MTGNYLNFAYFDSLMAVMITFVFLFIAPSIVLFLFFAFISDNNYKKIKTTINNLNLDFFLSSYAIIGLLLVIFSPILLYPKTTENNFNNVYDVKFIEKSPISEIQYSKKDNFNTGTIINSGTRNVEKCKFYSSRLFFVRGHNDDFIFKQMNIIVSLSLSISPLRNYNLKENEKLFFKIPPRATTEFSSFCPC